jgi:hypothetical protein
MLWKEVRTWATSHGYKVDRTKAKDQENSYNYTWSHVSCSGTAESTFALAKSIYNHITEDKYIDHQMGYSKENIHEQIFIQY